MSIGSKNFSGGETLRTRVSPQEVAAMARLSGYDPSDGSLRPEGLVADLTTGAPLPGLTPEQSPFAFAADGAVQIIARGEDARLHRFSDGAWSAAEGDALTAPPEATPVRLGDQVILPATGTRPQLMLYEPGSPSTKTRPLSLRSPGDYDADAVPTVTPSSFPGVPLFACADWGNAGTGCTLSHPDADTVVLTIGSGAQEDQSCMRISFGGSGVDLSGYRYLLLDVSIENDPQDYAEVATAFLNRNTFGITGPLGSDPQAPSLSLEERRHAWERYLKWLGQQQLVGPSGQGSAVFKRSGYHLVLCENADGTGEIKRLNLPRLLPLGQVVRLVFNLGTLSTPVIKSIALRTGKAHVPPPVGQVWKLTLSSAAFQSDWGFRGNFLLPPVVWDRSPWSFYLPPDGSGGTAVVMLQQFAPTTTGFFPKAPTVRYCYCLCGRSSLGADYALMTSNPSDPSAEVVADPWRTYTAELTLPSDGTHTPLTEYGAYLTHALLYRQRYDGVTDTYGLWEFIQAVPLAESMSYPDTGADTDPMVGDLPAPYELELANDFASSARYVTTSQRRVWAACLDWDEATGTWRRPTAIMVSSEEKPWAFPTTVDSETSLVTDGVELDGYAQTGSEVRGLLARNDEVFVFLDNECFLVRGDSPLGPGYQFTRLDAVGCRSARTLADCRSALIWHSGAHFYAYAGGLAQPISRHRIDSARIDWTRPHQARYWQEKYLFFCHYDGHPAVLTYDLSTGGWRTRSSAAYDFVGIGTSGDADVVYGVTPDGRCVSLFGGASDAGAAAPVREVHTQYWPVAEPGHDVQVAFACLEVVTDSAAGETLALTLRTQGRICTSVSRTLVVTRDRTYYEVPVNLKADAVKLEVTYTGTNPPVLHFLGFAPDPVANQ